MLSNVVLLKEMANWPDQTKTKLRQRQCLEDSGKVKPYIENI